MALIDPYTHLWKWNPYKEKGHSIYYTLQLCLRGNKVMIGFYFFNNSIFYLHIIMVNIWSVVVFSLLLVLNILNVLIFYIYLLLLCKVL